MGEVRVEQRVCRQPLSAVRVYQKEWALWRGLVRTWRRQASIARDWEQISADLQIVFYFMTRL
eukprot:7835878-Pyramimonas_sp.AAC.1